MLVVQQIRCGREEAIDQTTLKAQKRRPWNCSPDSEQPRDTTQPDRVNSIRGRVVA